MKMPVVFCGHGSPMLALENSSVTEELKHIGADIIADYGKPKAILAVSAHWYTDGAFVQDTEKPKQIYDMYGFPEELYQVKYPVSGSHELSQKVQTALGREVRINNDWGIDHGTWTVLVHMFRHADIPVVQLSVNARILPEDAYEIGRKLSSLREDGYLIFGSGNIVHNLRRVEWDSQGGTKEAHAFNQYMIDAVEKRQDDRVIHYKTAPHAEYAVPTPDHFLPLVYILGASGNDPVYVFNSSCCLGSIAMTGFEFRE